MNSNDRVATTEIVAEPQQVKGPQVPQNYGAGPQTQEAALTGTEEERNICGYGAREERAPVKRDLQWFKMLQCWLQPLVCCWQSRLQIACSLACKLSRMLQLFASTLC